MLRIRPFPYTVKPEQSLCKNMKNIYLEVMRREHLQVNQWRSRVLHKFFEEKQLEILKECKGEVHPITEGRRSIVAICFSHDGQLMASGHVDHTVSVYSVDARIRHTRAMVGHTRTPWTLTFDPTDSSVLYSGCLAGQIYKWNVKTGECLNHGEASVNQPINSIVFLPGDSTHFLISVGNSLCLLSADSLAVKWRASAFSKTRLVLAHPTEEKLLVALLNETTAYFGYTIAKRSTTYRLQLYPYSISCVPDLENTSLGLLCNSARICGPKSCAVTASYVICCGCLRTRDSHYTPTTSVKLFSILQPTFGQCLATFPVTATGVDVSPYGNLLCVCCSVNHLQADSDGPVVSQIYRLDDTSAVSQKHPVCSVVSESPLNVAVWSPASHGGLCMGTREGTVLHWCTCDKRDSSSDIDIDDERTGQLEVEEEGEGEDVDVRVKWHNNVLIS